MPDPTRSDLDFGYRFDPPAYPGCPGSPSLAIVLRSEPTGQHFDPVKVELPIVIQQPIVHGDPIQRLSVRCPWADAKMSYQVPAGHIVLRDQTGKTVEAFTFGGAFDIEEASADVILCRLRSPAPILHFDIEEDVPTLLSEEVEALLARRRALWLAQPGAYETRLAAVDPFRLYLACLDALNQQFSRPTATGGIDALEDLVRFVQLEIKRLQAMHEATDELPELTTLL